MGNAVSQTTDFLRSVPLKRKTLCYDEDKGDDSDSEVVSPKRCKVMSTTKYIYKTLFEEGQGSDVRIHALNRSWKLHKLYLSQSPYFNTMFNGPWVETTQEDVFIGIDDENVTSEALHKVLGSLYQDEIQVDAPEAVSIIACATLLQLDHLAHKCIEVMKDSISINTAVSFYAASELYSLGDLRKLALEWLNNNLCQEVMASPAHLREISCDLMTELVSSDDLIVIQSEYSVYQLLKWWVFAKENSYYLEKGSKQISVAVDKYFEEVSVSAEMPFLLANTGSVYKKAFLALHLHNLIISHEDIKSIVKDNIMPLDWFAPAFKQQWLNNLLIDKGTDKGPLGLTEEYFNTSCLRVGRYLLESDSFHWRWTGYNFGFDVVVSLTKNIFHLRRFCTSKGSASSSSCQDGVRFGKRFLMFKFKVTWLNKNGTLKTLKETGLRTVSLAEGEKVTVLQLENNFTFPLIVSVKFMVTSNKSL